MSADLLLIADRTGVDVARRQGVRVTGTLGVLDLAAEQGLVDFAGAIFALERTAFRRPDELLKCWLAVPKKQRQKGKFVRLTSNVYNDSVYA